MGRTTVKDPRFDEAVAAVVESRQGPASATCSVALRIGYNGAARLIRAMEQAGIVSRPNAMGKRKREVLAPKREE